MVRDGHAFQRALGVELPFADTSFDVVLTNHVIEHVGYARAKNQHLTEIRCVIKPEGNGYLVVPCRSMLTGSRYQIRFLGWRLHAWPRPYVRLLRNTAGAVIKTF